MRTTLHALNDAQKSGVLRTKAVLVISSNPRSYALTLARDNNIPFETVERRPAARPLGAGALGLLEKHRIELMSGRFSQNSVGRFKAAVPGAS
jgi:folate-dependent phosphoribosylglycinamide formyltransferase PurN